MAITCGKCGGAVSGEAQFCAQCGAPTQTDAALPKAQAASTPQRLEVPSASDRGPDESRDRGVPSSFSDSRMLVLPLAIVGVGVVLLIAALAMLRSVPLSPRPPAPHPQPRPSAPVIGVSPSVSPTTVPAGAATPVGRFTGSLRRPVAPGAVAKAAEPGGSAPAGASTTAAPAPPAVVAQSSDPNQAPAPAVVATFRCRRAADFDVAPEEAEIAVDGRVIGPADDWDDIGGGALFEFDSPGRHLVRLSLAGYQTLWLAIVVDPDAPDEVATIDLELDRVADEDEDDDDRAEDPAG